MSLEYLDNLQNCVSYTKQEEKLNINEYPRTLNWHVIFQERVEICPSEFYLQIHLKPLLYSPQIENKETFHQRIFYACQTIRKRPGNFKNCDSSWSDVSVRPLSKMEEYDHFS